MFSTDDARLTTFDVEGRSSVAFIASGDYIGFKELAGLREFDRLFDDPAKDTLLVKLNYWLSL